jgi:hypothetical protein
MWLKIIITVGGLMALLGTTPSAFASGDEEQIKNAITTFATGGDKRDLAALEKILDPSFRVVFAFPGKDASVMSRADYLGMLKEGKIGGGERKLSFGQVNIAGAIGHAKVEMVRDDARFDAEVTLVRGASGWRIIQDATLMTPTKAAPSK